MVLLHPHPKRIGFTLVDGVGHAGGGELHLERHVVDGCGTLLRAAVEHEQLIVVQRGAGVVRNGHGEPLPVRPGDVVVVPPHASLVLELDAGAEFLVVRRAGDDPDARCGGPSTWFG